MRTTKTFQLQCQKKIGPHRMSKINNFIHRKPSEKSCNSVPKIFQSKIEGEKFSHAGKVIAFSMAERTKTTLRYVFSLREYFTEASRIRIVGGLCGKSMSNIFYFLPRKIICFLGLKS